MAAAFILRFQEPLAQGCADDVSTSTATLTKIATEQSDFDSSEGSFNSISRNSLRAGTMTGTFVQTEQDDRDRTANDRTIPCSQHELSTKTITAVQAEETDDDYGSTSCRIVPKGSSF